MESLFAEARKDLSSWKSQQLNLSLVEREAARKQAEQDFLASHTDAEQVASVASALRMVVEHDAARRHQGEADDRFLSRKLWLASRIEEQSRRRMKTH